MDGPTGSVGANRRYVLAVVEAAEALDLGASTWRDWQAALTEYALVLEEGDILVAAAPPVRRPIASGDDPDRRVDRLGFDPRLVPQFSLHRNGRYLAVYTAASQLTSPAHGFPWTGDELAVLAAAGWVEPELAGGTRDLVLGIPDTKVPRRVDFICDDDVERYHLVRQGVVRASTVFTHALAMDDPSTVQVGVMRIGAGKTRDRRR